VIRLFSGADPVGQQLRVKNIPFTVIGVLQRKGANLMGQDQDDTIVVPYTTVMKRLQGSHNRLQMIVYAVIPQIVAPYISFTMYRWDINVRMSTIIGFAGGGGIGFLLQQNINLLNYRAASAQIIAIAIVVSLMDYFSSYMRQRVV